MKRVNVKIERENELVDCVYASIGMTQGNKKDCFDVSIDTLYLDNNGDLNPFKLVTVDNIPRDEMMDFLTCGMLPNEPHLEVTRYETNVLSIIAHIKFKYFPEALPAYFYRNKEEYSAIVPPYINQEMMIIDDKGLLNTISKIKVKT